MFTTKKFSISIFVFINVSMVFSSSVLKIPNDHPRVYIRPQHIPELKKKINNDQFKPAWNYVQKSNHPLCLAFKYLVLNDVEAGQKAIREGLADLKEATSPSQAGRREYRPNHYGACVYDWCYPLMTSKDKNDYIKEFIRIASLHRPFYPANENKGFFVSTHDVEGWVLTGQLPQGVAIYNENKTMYEAAEKVFLNKILPASNFYSKAHMHHQGDSYGASRFIYEIFITILYNTLGHTDIFIKDRKFVPYQFIYNLRPDLQQMRSGDCFDPKGVMGKETVFYLAGGIYNDPILLNMQKFRKFSVGTNISALKSVFYIITVPLRTTFKGVDHLPLSKYFSSPMGEIITRTGWDISNTSDDAIVHMRIGEYFFYGHQRRDFGIFQIYYKGTLTMTSGAYTLYENNHFLHYHHQTVSQNGLLIFDPNEVQIRQNIWTLANDGGQLCPYQSSPRSIEDVKDNKMGEVLAREIGYENQLPEYSYISGDITKAYSSKVEKVTRSMVTFNTGESKFPIIFMVFDRVISSNKNFKKTWLMHTLDEPTLSGTKMTAINKRSFYSGNGNYSGKLVAECLLPDKPIIKKIGGPGKEFWVESTGKNYPISVSKTPHWETGAWRFEVSPSVASKEDYFLHAMTVMDKNTILDIRSKKVEYGDMVGAHFLGKTSLFSRTGKLIDVVNINVDKEQDILLCDLKPGKWIVHQNGREDMTYTVSDTGRCVYLKDCNGTFRIYISYGTDLSYKKDNFLGQSTVHISSVFPNPGKDNIIITYTVPKSIAIQKNIGMKVELFDIKGKRFKSIVREKLVEGVDHISINRKLHINTIIPVGSYIIKMQIGSEYIARKIVIVK